jgi:hypothetical protein
LPLRLFAQGAENPHAVQPERPTIATHAHTVAPGWLELEEGGEWDSFSDGSRSFSAPANLKTGLAENAQLNLMASVIHDEGSTALSDVTAGVKYRLLDDVKVLGDFAIFPAVKFPTASTKDRIGTGTTDLSLLLISSHEVDGVSIDINAGATRRTGDGSRIPKTSTVWTTSLGLPIREELGWALELFGFPGTAGPAGEKGSAALLTGPTFSARAWLAFDAGVIEKLTGPQPRAVYAGFVWNLGKL